MRPPSTYAFRVALDRAGRDRQIALRGVTKPRTLRAEVQASTHEGLAASKAQRIARTEQEPERA